ncbi:hypothetical protein GP486_007748 [Trichoglossum hirsutum]|uniref:Uncharacterized protein n=1 Tax=Trichoglossum hirsutum TaxID=265104 RepID=A0A9P8L6N7_9PEZI|nr:hypothetical protein GP486_007748 [Trichoglossum hirsutum]
MILISGVSPEGHNWGPINLDAVGKGYIGILIVWSLVVFAGLYVLHINRRKPFIRMRNTRLTIAAVLTIHVYLSLVFLVYPLNGSFPCDAEYWIMSIYLPFGIALFQAQNLQLLSLSSMQKKLMLHPQTRPAGWRWPRGIAEMRKAWRRMNMMTRVYSLIGAGMVVQVRTLRTQIGILRIERHLTRYTFSRRRSWRSSFSWCLVNFINLELFRMTSGLQNAGPAGSGESRVFA